MMVAPVPMLVPPPSPSYWAFLSYSSLDRLEAIWLQRALEAYVVPHRLVGRSTPGGIAPRRYRPIFRDQTELAADPDLVAQIANALARSAYLIVLCSPNAARSKWVNEEIIRFREMHGGARILALILDGNPLDELNGCFPPALRYVIDAKGDRVRYEPIAADLRPCGDGRRVARLKLVSGMLGVGLDELVRRDSQRRHRHLTVVTAASLIGVIFASALATAALIARNDAQRQRAHAEGLIEFMLTDLRKKLEPSGRLDAMDGVGREAINYYKMQRPVDLDAQALARRARALRLMGEVSLRRGNLREGLENFKQAAATTDELVARSPDDPQLIFNHAQNVFWVGEVANQRGDSAQAETSFKEYLHLAQKLTAMDSGNDQWRGEEGYAYSAIGALFLQNGRAAEATVALAKALTVSEARSQSHPEDFGLMQEVSQVHAFLADSLLRQGRLVESRQHSERQLTICRTILAKDPNLQDARISVIDALQSLGELASLADDRLGAEAYFSEAAQSGEAVLVAAHEDMVVTSMVAAAQVSFGESLLATDQIEAARRAQQRGAALLAIALARDSTDKTWRNSQERATLLDAAVALKQGRNAEALATNQATLGRLDNIDASVPNTLRFWLLLRSRIQLGDVLSSLGRTQEARAQWDSILTALSNPLEMYEPKVLRVWADTALRMGKSEESARISTRLWSLWQSDSSQ